MRNYGIAGFILSTVLFVPLNKILGVNGLILATLISLSISSVFLFFLPKENIRQNSSDETIQEDKPSFTQSLKCMLDKRVIIIVSISSLLSIASLIVAFCYVLKLQESNLDTNWMSFIILTYSGLQMLEVFVIKKIKTYKPFIVMSIELLMIGATFFMLAFFSGYAVFIPMLILPFLVSLPGVLLSRLSNKLIDDLNLGEKRASFLSILNQGSNFVEVIFLFIASAISVNQISGIFIFLGCIFLGSSFLFLIKKKMLMTSVQP